MNFNGREGQKLANTEIKFDSSLSGESDVGIWVQKRLRVED